MARNPKFDALLADMKATHDRKNEDYASADNPYSNFEAAARIGGCSVDTVFRVLIGVKLARLDELLKGDKEPNHESVQDSRLDLAVYAALWASYHNAEATNYSTKEDHKAAPLDTEETLRALRQFCEDFEVGGA